MSMVQCKPFAVMHFNSNGEQVQIRGPFDSLDEARNEAKEWALNLGSLGYAAVFEFKERYQATTERVYNDAEDVAKAAVADKR